MDELSKAAPHVAGALVVTEAEAAKLLRLSRRTLQRLRVDGGGPAYVQLLAGSRIGYPVAALEGWLASRTVASTSEATERRRKDRT